MHAHLRSQPALHRGPRPAERHSKPLSQKGKERKKDKGHRKNSSLPAYLAGKNLMSDQEGAESRPSKCDQPPVTSNPTGKSASYGRCSCHIPKDSHISQNTAEEDWKQVRVMNGTRQRQAYHKINSLQLAGKAEEAAHAGHRNHL